MINIPITIISFLFDLSHFTRSRSYAIVKAALSATLVVPSIPSTGLQGLGLLMV
jgi:formate-dependent nitrite reductase membrane component NrfD